MSGHEEGDRRGREPAGAGASRLAGWLFTIGFAGLPRGKAIPAVLPGPRYLAAALR